VPWLRTMLGHLGWTERLAGAADGPRPRHFEVAIWVLGGLSSLVYASMLVRLGVRPILLRWGFPLQDFIPFFLGHFALLFALLLVAARCAFMSDTDDPRVVALIVGFGVCFRLMLLPTPPVLSSDVFRYIWDARVQTAGESPYLSTPASFVSASEIQAPLYQQQNRPFAPTIYPPLAEVAFRSVRAVCGESVVAMKALMVAGDLCALVLLLRLLAAFELPRSRIILYAWHPLMIVETAGSGHVDALMLPCILTAVLLWVRGRTAGAGTALAAATLLKIFPMTLVPAFFDRCRWRVLLWYGGAVALVYLPFALQAGFAVLGYLPQFLRDPGEVFNPSVMGVLLYLMQFFTGAPTQWVSWIGRAALIAVLLTVLRRPGRRPQDLLASIWVIAGALTLFTLTLHPWYLLWLLPFLAVQPKPAWVYLSGAVVLSYAFYLAPTLPIRLGIALGEYVPFVLLLARENARASDARL